MKRSRYSEEQVAGILRKASGGVTTKAVCAKHNISEQTFYNWKRKYQGMEVNDVRVMRKRHAGDLLTATTKRT